MLISNELRSQLITHTYSRTLRLEFNGVTIQSSNIISDTLEIESSIMDESTLVIGGCIASRMSIKVFNVNNLLNDTLSGVQIKAYITQNYTSDPLLPSDTLYPASDLLPGYTIHSLDQVIFTGYIYNIERQKQRNVFEIIAFDEMRRMSETKCKGLISGYLTYNETQINTLYKLMYTILGHYDDWYDTSFQSQYTSNRSTEFQRSLNRSTLTNITQELLRNYASEELSVFDILKAHSELNSRFAYFNANGDLCFVTFWEKYDDENQNEHTRRRNANVSISSYNNLYYTDYYTSPIEYISFPYEGNKRYDYGITNDKRRWYISNNAITNCSTDASSYITAFYRSGGLNYIFYNLYSYRPYSVATFGEWWIEPGDIVSLPTDNSNLPTLTGWVLTRRIKGVSGMKVELEAKGSKYFTKEELVYPE